VINLQVIYFYFERLVFDLLFLFFYTPYPEGRKQKYQPSPLVAGVNQLDFSIF